jgi:hypothetical protein
MEKSESLNIVQNDKIKNVDRLGLIEHVYGWYKTTWYLFRRLNFVLHGKRITLQA